MCVKDGACVWGGGVGTAQGGVCPSAGVGWIDPFAWEEKALPYNWLAAVGGHFGATDTSGGATWDPGVLSNKYSPRAEVAGRKRDGGLVGTAVKLGWEAGIAGMTV